MDEKNLLSPHKSERRSASARSTLRRLISARPRSPNSTRSLRIGGVAPAGGEINQPDRLLFCVAIGAGDAGDGNGKACARMGERAARHGPGHVLAHRAVALDQPEGHAEHLALGAVRIGHEAALEDVGRAGDGGQRGGNKSSGAGLRGRHRLAAGAAGLEQLRGLGKEPLVDLDSLRHGRLTVAVAIAAIPSPLPIKPKPSLVVALMLTCETSRPSIEAMHARI